MPEFRRILCPVDSSAFSRNALRYGAALGAWFEAEVIALTVRPAQLPPALWFAQPSALPLEGPEEQARAVDSLRGFIHSVVGDTPIRAIVVDGRIVPEILRVARELPADLIVMGTHGLSGFDRLLLGSVTEKTLGRAECPVLTIPRLADTATRPADIRFGTIVCGMDQSASSKAALAYASSIAKRSRGRLVLVHVMEDFLEEEPRLAGHFDTDECWRAVEPEIRATYESLVSPQVRQVCEVELRTPRGKAYRELLAAARESKADLIVLGTSGSNTPFGATTLHVLRAAACPVLAVPSARAQTPTAD